MVFSGETEEGVRDLVMAVAPERSKPPLHNFDLPCLKWGNQRHLRCMKVAADGTDRARTARSPPSKLAAARDYDVRRFKKHKPAVVEEGIDAVREKLMCDFKAAADKLKATILSEGVSDDGAAAPYRREREEVGGEKERSQPLAAVAVEAEEEARPWNLRTRRAACRAPVGGNSDTAAGGGGGKALRIEERRASHYSPARSETAKSPRLLKDKEIERPRPKFSVTLSRKEIEEDFMAMLNHKPARRPKKRPRNVQKQLDMLFPGLWLTEVTVDSYKVPELPDNGKK